jgi:hypothetical protein
MDAERRSRPTAGGPCPKCGANIAFDTIVCTSCAAWRPHRGRSRPRKSVPAGGRTVHERRAWLRVALLVGSLGAAAAVAHATRVLSAARPAAPPAAASSVAPPPAPTR